MIPPASPVQGLQSALSNIGPASGAASQLGITPTASSASPAGGNGGIYDRVASQYLTGSLGLTAPMSSQDLGLLMSGQNITAGGGSFGLNSPVDAAQAKALGFSPDIKASDMQGYLVGQSAFDAFAGIDPNNVYGGLVPHYISQISAALQKAYPQLASQQQQPAAAPAAPQPVGVGPWGVIP